MFIDFRRSAYDAPGESNIVSEYLVEMSNPPGLSGFSWIQVGSVQPNQNPQYTFIAPTPNDSSTNSSGTFYFRITARTDDPNEYWRSNIMSGHSVDNLSPLAPTGAALTPLTATSLRLHWNEDTHDPDVHHYAIYRSLTSGFPLADSTGWGIVSDTTVVDSTLSTGEAYYYRITTVDIHGNESTPSPQLLSPNALVSRASVKVLLEGPYNSSAHLMNTTLHSSGFLASHFGSIPIPAQAVDSITIELRNASSASASTTRKFLPAWLLSDGTIRDFADTAANFVTFDTLAGEYYLVIYHRNHIPVMTAASLALNGAQPSLPFDFTTSESQAYGGNPMKALTDGRFAMIAGDASGNGQVANSDINALIRPAIGQSGYRNADTSLNGQVQNSDINSFTRPNIGRGSQLPARPVTHSLKEGINQ